ncbi:Na+ ATPase [Orbilia brochopaga]|uniref:P-type Na(+) transporter n=1 Tax=Orbilia brochopaga TaxID=3140254 RepID=A0AAV9UAY1_9PEZI
MSTGNQETAHAITIESPPHAITFEEVAKQLKTDVDKGLSATEAKKRLGEYGPNVLEGGQSVKAWKVLAKQLANAMILVLVLAMILSYATKDWIEGGVLAGVIALNVFVGFYQEYNAEKTMESLKSLSSPTASVIREGRLLYIPSMEVVPGDIVELKTGDVVPADLRMIPETLNFEADEALLTGESLPVPKNASSVLGVEVGLGDRINLAFSSTTVTRGRGRGIVIGTGMETAIGAIARSLQGKKSRKPNRSLSRKKHGPLQPAKGLVLRTWDAIGKFLGLTVGTPLQRKLAKLAYLLLGCAVILAIIVFGANKFHVPHEVVIYAISLAIAIIPESLPAVLTITFSVGMSRMVKRKVIVRKLDSLESLGGVTNISSDKTGTITQGKMITRKFWLPSLGVYSVENTADASDPTSGTIRHESEPPKLGEKIDGESAKRYNLDLISSQISVELLVRICALCNVATVRYDEETKEWQATGDPTEIALQVFAHRFDSGKKQLLGRGWAQEAEFPFDSEIKRMSVVFREVETEAIHVFTKGAVERILDLCTSYGVDGTELERGMTEDYKKVIMDQVEELAGQGLRVLALARRSIPSRENWKEVQRDEVERDLTFVGLAGLYDPPRLESRDAIRLCKQAGIKVHMLTGDHRLTAAAIAREVGIIPAYTGRLSKEEIDSLVMTATEFDSLSDSEIDALPTLPVVIARCAPTTKVRMIQALHRRGLYCAMTGDGVNDSPSLKQADVGIAMGLGGSDVAKSASDIVLTDDNFASIVNAIEEGRRMFENIQKFVLHLLVGNVGEVILLVIGLAFRDEDDFSTFPLAPLAILWINMLTSSFPAFGLSLEPAGTDIMKRPPHDNKAGVFTWEIIVDMLVYGIIMGGCAIGTFTIIVYGVGDGVLGRNCNTSYNDSCDAVFRARGAVFALIVWLILLSAWEFKSIRRSVFRLKSRRDDGEGNGSPWAFFKDLYENKFLFWAVAIGFVSVFPAIYIPKLNTSVFKHKPITWEWALPVASVFLFVAGVEAWKAVKRRTGWFEAGRGMYVSNQLDRFLSTETKASDLGSGKAV